jgi:hypothetical protein
MKRRHLFDNGHPVCAGTLVAGAQVLLAVSSQSLRHSRRRLAFSLVALANGAESILASLALCGRTAIELEASREKYDRLRSHASREGLAARSSQGARLEPGDRRPRPQPHPR